MISRNNSTLNNTAQESFNVNQWRESFILSILRIGSLLGIGVLAVSLPPATPNDRVLFIGIYILLLTVTLLPISYNIRSYSVIALIFIIGANSILTWGPWIDGSLFFLASVIMGGFLFDRRIDIAILVLSVSLMTLIAILQTFDIYQLSVQNMPVPVALDWANYIFDFMIMGAVIVAAMGQLKTAFSRIIEEIQNAFNTVASERSQLESKVRERTEDLEARMAQLRNSTLTARTIAEKQTTAELLEATTQLVSEKFGYYHVGLFILDEQNKIAFLQASSSATGRLLIGQGFRVEPDRKNLLATAIEQNRAIISTDLDQKNFVKDDNFPITRSRMVLPLTVRGVVIGLLDLHSDQTRAFNVDDAEILQTLADLTAISLDNVRLINETQNLVNQLETDTSVQTQRIWSKLTSRQKPSYQYTPAGVRPVFFRGNQKDDVGLRVPLTLHGQSIGSIKLRRNTDADWSEREKVLIEKIADQVALALENSRLVDEAQKNAAREQMIANISTRIRETLDINAVAKTAVSELQRVFDLKEAEIVIGSPNPSETPQ